MDFPGGSVVKNSSAKARDAGSIPASGRSPGKGMATYSSILTWEMSWTEETGRPQFMRLQESNMTLQLNNHSEN